MVSVRKVLSYCAIVLNGLLLVTWSPLGVYTVLTSLCLASVSPSSVVGAKGLTCITAGVPNLIEISQKVADIGI